MSRLPVVYCLLVCGLPALICTVVNNFEDFDSLIAMHRGRGMWLHHRSQLNQLAIYVVQNVDDKDKVHQSHPACYGSYNYEWDTWYAIVSTSPEEEEHLVVDSDGGADDGFAILTLLAAEQHKLPGLRRTRVVAITSVTGNTGVDNATTNILATLGMAHRQDIPVFKGASQAILGSPPSDNFYGEDGFGDFLDRNANYGEARGEHAVAALTRIAADNPGKITLLCIGPLTNIAMAIRFDPKFLKNIKAMYILGGASHGIGNTKAGTEFNTYMDPEAAEVVFANVIETVAKVAYLVTWDAALDFKVSQDWRLNVLGKVNKPEIQAMNLAERETFSPESTKWTCGDAIAVAAVLDDQLFAKHTLTQISVVLDGGFARGATLVDYVNKSDLPRNVVLFDDSNTNRFESLLLSLFPST